MHGGLAGPMMLMTARARRRPSTWFLPALGIALAVAFAGAVAAEGVIAGDQAARAALAQLTPLERTVRVTWQGALTTGIDRRAHTLLDRLGLGVQTQVVLLNPVRLSGVIVRPAAISPLGRWIPAAAADRLGRCRAERCPVLLASGGRVPSTLAATGVSLRIAGTSPLRSAVPLAYETSSEGQWPLVLTGDTTGLDVLAGLSGVYRIHSWLAVLTVHNLHSWQLANVERRLADTQAALLSSGSQFSMSGPFDALDAARAQAGSAPSRLLLVGGGAAATLVLFVVLSAAALRREQLAELQRLRGAGAHAGQLLAFAAGETALLSAVALLAGATLAIGATLALARAAREPPGAVLAHSLLTPAAVLALAGCWAVAALLITASVFTRAKGAFDVLAVAAIAALVAGMHAGTGAQGAGAASTLLLLAPLCCLAAGVVVFRVAVPLLRAAERAARRGPVLARLALTGLARAPELPALSVAFLAVSVGLGGFALAYRATLDPWRRGSGREPGPARRACLRVCELPDPATARAARPLARARTGGNGAAGPPHARELRERGRLHHDSRPRRPRERPGPRARLARGRRLGATGDACAATAPPRPRAHAGAERATRRANPGARLALGR